MNLFRWPFRRPRLSRPRLILFILGVTYFLYFGFYAVQRYRAFETGAFDLGVYAQPLWNFIHGRGFAVSLIEDNGPLRWATHVEPILFLIAPFYRLWPDPRLLLWLQAAGLSLAALPLYALATRRLNREWLALVIVAAYFLMPAAEAVTLFDFHAVSLAPLFLLSAIYFLDRALASRGISFWLWPERVSQSADRPGSERSKQHVDKRAGHASEAGVQQRLGEKADQQVTVRQHWQNGNSTNGRAGKAVYLQIGQSINQEFNKPTEWQKVGIAQDASITSIIVAKTDKPNGEPPITTSNTSPQAAHTQGQIHNSQLAIHNWQFYMLSGLFFLLALATKEDISLLVLMIGLYLAVLRRCWWEGVSLILAGLIWFYVAFQIIIPAFRTGGGQSIYLAWFETLGSTPVEVALSPFTAPDKVLALLFRPGSLTALGMLTLPQALLPLFGLPLFVLAAPSLAFSMLSQNPTLRQFESWHYAAPMLPFIMLGAVDGMARLAHYASRFPSRASRPAVQSVSLKILAILLLLTAVGYHRLRGYSPLAQLYEWPEVTAHHRLGQGIGATIPTEAAVLAQAQLVPPVAHRQQLGIWNGPLNTDYDYIWLDLSHPRLPNRLNAHGELLTGLTIEPDFGFALMQDGYLLLKKGAERMPLAEDLFTFTRYDRPPGDARPVGALFGDVLKLVAIRPEVRRLATPETEPQVMLYFETLQKPAEDYHLFVYLLDQTGAITGATDFPQPAVFWWPISRWEAGDRRQVRINTMPWWTGDKPAFGYALGITRVEDPWNVSARLPVTLTAEGPLSPGGQPIDEGTLLPLAAFRRFGGLPYPQPLTILHPAEDSR